MIAITATKHSTLLAGSKYEAEVINKGQFTETLLNVFQKKLLWNVKGSIAFSISGSC